MRYSFPCGSPEGTWACVLQAVTTGRLSGRGHRVFSQVHLLLQFPGSAGRAVHWDAVFSTLQCRLLGSAVTSYDTHVYFYSNWSAGCLTRRGWAWHGRVVTLCSCHFAYMGLALSCFSVVKSFSFMVSGCERFICCEEYDPKLTAYLQIALLTLAQCLPPGWRGLQLGSVKIVLFLYQSFSFHYAPAEIVCLC